jgi:biotin operon repressor
MEQNQMSTFSIDLEGMTLPDAIAAVVEAWYEAQNTEIDKSDKIYSIEQLQKVFNRSRASIYRMLNTDKDILNPPFDPARLNYKYRVDSRDPILVSSIEVARWKNESQQTRQVAASQILESRALKENDLDCARQVLDHIHRLSKAGLLTNGDKMPSLRDLSNRLDMHRNTVAKVYENLEIDGAIVATPGSGFYIIDINKMTLANAI